MPSPSPKFAVVREDPELELELVDRTRAAHALVVASGGCTAIALAARRPGLRVTAFDLSPAQIAHAKAKVELVASGQSAALNVATSDPTAHNQAGEFERLFRALRAFLAELVIAPGEIERFFSVGTSAAERRELAARWRSAPQWAPAFAALFTPSVLVAMFGPDAVRHAAPGSYGPYFQRAFERGLAREDAGENPFLAHVLLGRYTEAAPPPYPVPAPRGDVTWVEGSLDAVPDLQRFGVVSLSNVFDWSDDDLVRDWAARLASLRPGSAVLVRVLNNQRDVRPAFAEFSFDEALGADFFARDRSLFYERFVVGFRR